MATGTVKSFDASQGLGVIQPDDGGQDLVVHISAVERAGLKGLHEGQSISYDVQAERGTLSAVNLKEQKKRPRRRAGPSVREAGDG